MPDVQPSLVTPEGVRDGDPAALSGLTTRRGAAVLAYTEQVARPGRSVDAAAEAFARFRQAVVAADDPYDVDPERTLLRTTRFAAAAVAPIEVPLRSRLRGSSGPSPCELVPELLAARAEGELSIADQDRLSRHLLRCAGCSATEARFRAGERAYRAAPDVPPVTFASRAIMEALMHAAPSVAGARETEAPVAAPEPVPLDATVEFDALAAAAEAEPHHQAAPVAAELEPQAAPVAVLTEPEHFVPEPFDDEPYEYAPEPTVTHVAAAERQETYEFDALPEDAFDLEDEAYEYEDDEVYAEEAQQPRRGPSWLTLVAFFVLVVVVLAALGVVVVAVLDVRA